MPIAALSCALLCLAPPQDVRPEAMVDSARLMNTLGALPTKRAVRGNIESQQGLVKTEELVQQWLTELGYEPKAEALAWNLKYQADQEAKANVPARKAPETTDELAAHTWHNYLVDLPGKELPNEVLVLSCHFDAAVGAPGADDDGSGVAALLEVARVLKDRPMRRSVRLIFFNLEEIGLKGSIEHVKAFKGRAGPEKIIGMVSLEMLGYFTDEPGSQKSPIGKIEGVFDPPTVGDFIGIATVKAHQTFSRQLDRELRASEPKLKTVLADFVPIAPPDFLRSDHAPFLLSGMPAVMLTDTSNFRNPNYHKPTDTVETIDKERFTQVVRAVAGAAYRIAEPLESKEPQDHGPGAR